MEGPLSTSPTKLLCEHMEAKRSALEAFNTSSSYGTNFVTTNSKSLERDIDEKFAYYRELNESKKLGKRLKATMEQLSDNQMYRFGEVLAFESQAILFCCNFIKGHQHKRKYDNLGKEIVLKSKYELLQS